MIYRLMQRIRNWLRFDGIQDDELPPGSDWQWLTPMERLGVQSKADADIARSIIEQRKRNAVSRLQI